MGANVILRPFKYPYLGREVLTWRNNKIITPLGSIYIMTVMECTCNPLANLSMVMAFPLFCSIELADFPCNAFSATGNQKYLPAKQLTQQMYDAEAQRRAMHYTLCKLAVLDTSRQLASTASTSVWSSSLERSVSSFLRTEPERHLGNGVRGPHYDSQTA